MLLNVLLISLEEPLNCSCTQVSIKVNVFRQNAIECLQFIHLSEFISWGGFNEIIAKFFIKNVFFKNIGNGYSLKILKNY